MALEAVAVSQSPEDKFREYLLSRPTSQRFTGQQRDLVAHIFARHKHFDTDELLADLKAAERAVSRATVYRLVDEGRLERVWVGTSIRVPAQSLDAYLEASGPDVQLLLDVAKPGLHHE